MKILITGFSGFVSRHFIEYLFQLGVKADVLGIDITLPAFCYENYGGALNITFEQLDLLDEISLEEKINEFVPDYVLHLASYSSVAYSWKNPTESFKNNTNIFLNLVNAVRKVNRDCRILSVGSSEEYGNVCEDDLPLTENQLLQPGSPYAVARVAQELLSKVFAESFQMNIILTRSFNHIGPFQDERFVVPSFIRRILNIADAEGEGVIETGDLSIVRDFVDVRDVVKAYYLLLMKGTPGQIYNICSGHGVSLQTVVNHVSEYLNIRVQTRINPEYIRPKENKIMIGSFLKIERELGWKPEISLERTLDDMVEFMKRT